MNVRVEYTTYITNYDLHALEYLFGYKPTRSEIKQYLQNEGMAGLEKLGENSPAFLRKNCLHLAEN
jgi:hypothetical protein